MGDAGGGDAEGELVTADGLSDEADGVADGAGAGELQPAVTASAAPAATAHVISARTRGRAQSQCTGRL